MKTQSPKSKTLATWNSKQETVIKRCVDDLAGILDIAPNGNVSTTKVAELEIYLKILTQNINISGISDLETKRNLILTATFVRFGKYRTKDAVTFRRALNAETNRHVNRPLQKFWVLLPLNVKPGELAKFRSFSVLNCRLLVKDWKYTEMHYEYGKFMSKVNRQLPSLKIPVQSYFTPILVAVDAQDHQQAFYQANRSFDLFRTLLNLQLTFGAYTMQFGGYPKPLGKILPPPIYGIFDENGRFVEFYYNTVRNYDYTHNSIPDDRIVRSRNLARKLVLNESKDNTMSLNIEILEKYGEALDTSEWRLSFLELWQILELITLQSNEEFSMRTVVNRINILFGQNQRIRDLLSALYKTRNLLVHSGHFPDEQGLREVNLLRHIVEPCVNSMIAQMKRFPTRDSLNKFYEHAASNNADLAERARIISYIQGHRAKRTK